MTQQFQDIAIYGASGLCRLALDTLAQHPTRRVRALLDSDAGLHGTEVDGVCVFGDLGFAPVLIARGVRHFFVAVGDNRARVDLSARLRRMGATLISIVHPSASIAASARIQDPVFIGARAIICVDVEIGADSIVAAGAIIDHDSRVGRGVHIHAAARLAGAAKIDDLATVGVGAAIIPGRRVGRAALVEAGAVVIRDVPDGERVSGAPAKLFSTPGSAFVHDEPAPSLVASAYATHTLTRYAFQPRYAQCGERDTLIRTVQPSGAAPSRQGVTNMAAPITRRALLHTACFGAAALALGSWAHGSQDSQPQPSLLDAIRAGLKDPGDPFTLVVELALKPGSLDTLRPALDAAVRGTAREPGVMQYEFHQHTSKPDTLLALEQWRSLADLEAHLAAEYTAAALAKFGEVAAGPPRIEIYQRIGQPAIPVAPKFAGFYRFKIGSIEATAVSDGHIAISPIYPAWGHTVSEAELQAVLKDAFLPTDRGTLECACLALELGGERVLIDAGSGPLLGPNTGHLETNLAAAGIDPASITAVVLTHAHPDHLGGLLNHRGKVAFPRARVLLTKTEHAFWTGAAPDLSKVPVPDGLKQSWIEAAKTRLAAYAGKLELLDGAARPLPGIEIVATPGHTPGHAAVLVTSGAESLLVTGDVIGHHVIGVERVDLGSIFDTDVPQAIATRRALLDRAAAERLRLFSYHLAWPGLGRVRRTSTEAFQWVLEPMQWHGTPALSVG